MLYRLRKINFRKKGLALMAALMMVVVAGRVSAQTTPTFAVNSPKGVTSAEEAIVFINELGYNQELDLIMDDIVRIPKKFDAVYEHYNELQQKNGMNLAKHKGKKVNRYCFLFKDHGKNYRITILVYKGKVIGGDIALMELGGEMKGLEPSPSKANTPPTPEVVTPEITSK